MASQAMKWKLNGLADLGGMFVVFVQMQSKCHVIVATTQSTLFGPKSITV